MTPVPVLEVERLGKRYGGTRRRGLLGRIGGGGGTGRDDPSADLLDEDDGEEEDDVLADGPAPPPAAAPGWVLRDVSLTLRPGGALGVVGPNGAGKTTLLKILGRITPPSEGRILVRGRVAPLIESAAVFVQGDLTVRQNVRQLGRMLGVPGEVIARRAPAVVELAGLSGREDAKAKHLSSGGLRRLAYAATLELDPALLLADEALGVGDDAFRHVCLGRVRERLSGGMALVFASHDLEALAEVCDEALWLEHGRVRETGPAADVLERYGRGRRPPTRAGIRRRDATASLEIGPAHAETGDGEPAEVFVGPGQAPRLAFELLAHQAVSVRCSTTLWRDGVPLFRAMQDATAVLRHPGRYAVRLDLPAGVLPDGEYEGRVRVRVRDAEGTHDILRDRAYGLVVEASGTSDPEPDPDPRLDLPWSTALVEDQP